MKVQSRRSFVVACALALLLIFGWTAVSVGADSVACARRHTVQPGENLTSIAVFYGMTVEQLLDLNTIMNPDLIRVGISLCVSTILPTTESPRSISTDPKLPAAGQTSNQSVALSIDYIRRTDAADSVEFGTKSGLVGLRRLYPLESQGLEIFENSAGLLTALGDQPVVFYGIQWAGKGYALIEPAVTLSVLRPPLSGCPTPLRLGDEGILPDSAQLTVETQNEPNIVFQIAALGHQPGLGVTDECGSGEPAFALAHSRTGGLYRLLVVDQSSAPAEAATPKSTNRFVIESRFVVTASQPSFPLPHAVSRRLVFELPSTTGVVTGVQTLLSTAEVGSVLLDRLSPQPLYYGVRLSDSGPFRLVAIEDRSLLTAIGGTEDSAQSLINACDNRPVADVLSGPDARLDRITAYLENDTGLRLPFLIAEVAYARDVNDARGCDPEEIAFVLRPNQPGDGYQLFILLKDGGIGIPGEFRAQNCPRWQDSDGWQYDMLERIFGC